MNTKKKIFTIILTILFIGVAAFNVHMNAEQNQSLNQSSKVTLQNIAALTASADEDGDEYDCPGGPVECVRVYVGDGEVHIYYEE